MKVDCKDYKKFLEVFSTDEWEVETDTGWKDIIASGKTIEYKVFELILENGLILKGADNHIVINDKNKEMYLSELLNNDYIKTFMGISKVKSIKEMEEYEEMYDIEINSDNHTYFTNHILSHNSTWLGNLALSSSQLGHNTAYVTFELQEEIINMRIGSNMFNVPLDDYENWAKDQDALKRKITEARSSAIRPLGVLHTKEFPSSTCSVNDLRTYLKKAEETLGIKFDNIFVDYINIMKNWRNPNTENTYMKIKQIAEDLRAMAMEEMWAIITATQTNRCISPNSIIYHREKGKIEIKDVNIGDYILGDEGYKKVTNKWSNPKTKTYKIKTKSGKEIIASGNHIFPINNSMKEVSNLKKGDKIYIKNNA